MMSSSTLYLIVVLALVHVNLAQKTTAKLGFQCHFGDTCEKGAKCLPLHGMWACVPEQDFSRDGRVGILGECNTYLKCDFSTKCVSGVCVRDMDLRCTVSNVPWQNLCREYRSCQGGFCMYAAAGAPCRTEWRVSRCLPGLRCVGAKANGPANAPGRCVAVKEGARCLFTSKCASGTFCTSNYKCESSATGTPCSTSFTCPLDHACVNRKCVPGVKVGWDNVPTEGRGAACKTELNCEASVENVSIDARCINHICVPGTAGSKCTAKHSCGAGTDCRNGICIEATRGEKCGSEFGAGSCYYGLTCEYWKRPNATCVTKGLGRGCKTFSQCPPGMACNRGKCTLGTQGKYCVHHAHCVKGLYCVDRVCTTPRRSFGGT